MDVIFGIFISIIILGVIISVPIFAIKKLYKLSENFDQSANPNFSHYYRWSVIGIPILFVISIVILNLVKSILSSELQTAILVVLYGMLWVMAIVTFAMGFHRIRSQLIVPGLLTAVVIVGCIAFSIVSKSESPMDIIKIGLIVGSILLIKGLLGPIAVASSLSIAAYGFLGHSSEHLFLFKDLVFHIIGQANLVTEYLLSIIVAVGAIGNAIAVDFKITTLIETNSE
jgi:hypothetical protein